MKRFRKAVMAIGRIVYLDDKKFSEVIYASGTVGVKDMTAEEINRMAGV